MPFVRFEQFVESASDSDLIVLYVPIVGVLTLGLW